MSKIHYAHRHRVFEMMQFDPKDYWRSRLISGFDLEGVGQRNCGIHYNRWAYRVKRRVFLRLIRSLDVDFGSADTLDIGAGTGFYVDCWKKLGVRSVAGIDLTDVAVSRLRKRYPHSAFYNIDIGKDIGELHGHRFDVVSCMDVLFHIVNDVAYRKAIENVRTLLKPGGFFVFTEAFVHGPTRRSEHVVHRGLHDIESILHGVGFRILNRQPFLVLMNDPVEPGRPFLTAYWRLLQTVVQHVHLAGAVAGAVLYPMELALVWLLKEGPSTQITLCQRPLCEANAAAGPCVTGPTEISQ